MAKRQDMNEWDVQLRKLVVKHPIVLIKLQDDEFEELQNSQKGVSEFTLNYRRSLLKDVVPPCLCVVTGTRVDGWEPRRQGKEYLFVAVLKSKNINASLDIRIKVQRVGRVQPILPKLAARLDGKFSTLLRTRMKSGPPLVRLSPKLSAEMLEALLLVEGNRGALRMVSEGLSKKTIKANERLQTDAIQTALKAFGLSADAPAAELELVRGRNSSLAGARIMEDAVIEHDARSVPKYELVTSDITGRAMFRNGNQTLEVITANRRKLEEVFGVDLIYVNRHHSNVVMVQYKMLEQSRTDKDGARDWIYAEDRHLEKQISAMNRFKAKRKLASGGYRLSREFFYFKFVRRQASSDLGNLLIPLKHLEELRATSRAAKTRGGLRLSYDVLNGRYMRQTAFFSLLQAGYIGADVHTSRALETLISDLLEGGDSVVIALQRVTTEAEDDRDRVRRIALYDDAELGLH